MLIAPPRFPPLVPPLVPDVTPTLILGMPAPPPPRIDQFTARRSARCAVRGPEDPGSVRELWIALHGYGQLATDMVAGLSALDDGTRLIVAPEALSRFYDARGELSRHHEARVGASWMTREERLRDIEDVIGWLQQAYESYAARVPTSATVHVIGFSQGAAAASRWVAAGRVPARHLIGWGASLAPELDLGAAGDAENPLRRATVQIVIGERDEFVSAANIAAESARLDAAGFTYEMVSFAGGHRLDDETLRAVAGAGA